MQQNTKHMFEDIDKGYCKDAKAHNYARKVQKIEAEPDNEKPQYDEIPIDLRNEFNIASFKGDN